MINKLKNKLSSHFVKQPLGLLKSASATTIVRASGMAMGIFISIFLGRIIGADGLGIINLSNQIVVILLLISLLGFPTVVMKEVSIGVSRKDWHHVNSIMCTSLLVNGIVGSLIILASYLLIPYFVIHVFDEPKLLMPLTIALIAMFFQIFSRIFSAGVRGYDKIWQSSLVDNALSLYIVGLVLLFQFIFNYKISIITVAWSYAVSRIIVALSIGFYWQNIKHKSVGNNFMFKTIFKVALPLLLVDATRIVSSSIDSIMIGSFINTEAVGLYSIALRIAFVSSFFLQIANAVISPKVASMYANGKIKELEPLIQNIFRLLTALAIIFLGVIFFYGKSILSIWGYEFQSAYYPLVFLSLGQTVSVSVGCVGLIMMLCGQEKLWGLIVISSAFLNIMLNYFLIKFIGINGAAIATSTTMIIVNIIGFVMVKKRIGIQTIKLFLNKK